MGEKRVHIIFKVILSHYKKIWAERLQWQIWHEIARLCTKNLVFVLNKSSDLNSHKGCIYLELGPTKNNWETKKVPPAKTILWFEVGSQKIWTNLSKFFQEVWGRFEEKFFENLFSELDCAKNISLLLLLFFGGGVVFILENLDNKPYYTFKKKFPEMQLFYRRHKQKHTRDILWLHLSCLHIPHEFLTLLPWIYFYKKEGSSPKS